MRKFRPKKRKGIAYEVIPRDSVPGHSIYGVLDSLVEAHHGELQEARIALAWCTSWKPDADGHVRLGQMKKAGDLDRELHDYDAVILLRRAFWHDDRVTAAQKRALLDHELCHLRVKTDKDGILERDESGRVVYRVRKHDLEEFNEIVKRHGMWKADIEAFVRALPKQLPPAYEPCDVCREGLEGAGWVRVDEGGVRKVRRCDCYVAWLEQRREVLAS
jgi:hypothetical protein